jgi:hypothetical protein
MAKKKKSAAKKKAKGDELEQALNGLEKAVEELNLSIKTIRELKGHGFLSGGTTDGHGFTS